LWRPGGALRALPYSPLAGYVFDLSPRLVAYGTGCRGRDTVANDYYATCPVLRVFDVVTGALVSFVAPVGTAGRVPFGFDVTHAIAPRDAMIAAYAATRPLGQGQDRLFVMRLTGVTRRPLAVPSSTARLWARTATGSWLFYQGPRAHAGRPGQQREDPRVQHTMLSQNATFALMIDRAPCAGYGTASALWNLAYDAGYGAGPAVFGVFVVYTGYPAAFALTGMLMLAALVPAARDRAAHSHDPADPPQVQASAPAPAWRPSG
jgi:hypothetical protein